jgi:hypothetical protein
MESLEIRDDDGDAFTLEVSDSGAAVCMQADVEVVNIGSTGARAMVDWLTERFGLTRELTAIGMDPGLEIAVETETGKSRTVRWYGPDVPGELIKLAEIALRVPQGPAGPTLAERLRHEASPESLAILRQLTGTLGCERVDELPARVQGLVQELDNLAQDIARMAGVEIGPNGANLRVLLEKIQEKHRTALANTKRDQESVVREAQRKLRLQAQQHDEFRRSVPAQIEQAMAIERNARAAVQVELEKVRDARDRALREVETLKIQRQNAEEAEASAHAKLELACAALISIATMDGVGPGAQRVINDAMNATAPGA